MTDENLFNEEMYAFDNGVVVNSIMNNYVYLKLTKNNYDISEVNVKKIY